MKPEQETRLVSYDVGGRGFGCELKYPKALEESVVHLLFEADAGCAEEMMRSNPEPERFFVAPFGLGGADGPRRLHITQNPYASSLLVPDKDFCKSTCEVELSGEIDGVAVEDLRYDALYTDEYRVVRTADVSVRALDSVRATGELPLAAPPDFLSLDTQGTEYEILEGARQTIRRSVLALTTEIEFRPMYEGQRLFPDIYRLALEEGFEFVGFPYLQEVAPVRMPVGARGWDFVAFGDALFFRRLDALRKIAASEVELFAMGLKLAFIAICYNRLGHALSVLDETFKIRPGDDVLLAFAKHGYFRLLERLYAAYRRMPARFLHFDRHRLARDIHARTQEREAEVEQAAGDAVDPNHAKLLPALRQLPKVEEVRLENPAVADVATVLPADYAKATSTHGVSILGYGFVPKIVPSVLRLAVEVTVHSEADNLLVLAVFGSDPQRAMRLVSQPVAAGGKGRARLELYVPLTTLDPSAYDVRIGPARPGTFSLNGPPGSEPSEVAEPASLTVTLWSVDQALAAGFMAVEEAKAAAAPPKPTHDIEDALKQFGFLSLAEIVRRRRVGAELSVPSDADARD